MFFGWKIKSATIYLFLYFFLLALTGSLLLKCPIFYSDGNVIPFIDALFTTVSAICVTGLSSVNMSVFSGWGFALIAFLIEAGGLGLVVFFSVYLVFSAKKISLLNRNIIHDYWTEESQIEVRGILKRIICVTLCFQFSGAVFLAVILKNAGVAHYVLHGIFLAVSAFCNAGFSPYSDSLVQFSANIPFCLTICFLIIFGGLGFFMLSEILSKILRQKKKNLSLHSKIVILMTSVLLFSGTVILYFCEKNSAFKGMNFPAALTNAFFESVTLRTAGFETVAQREFSPVSTFVSIILMLIGGSPGSMAGGLKTTTVFLLCFYTYRNSYDRGAPSIFKRDIPEASFLKAIKIFIKIMCFLCVMMFFLFLAENAHLKAGLFSMTDLIFEAVSAFATVGLSKGITTVLSETGKIIIIVMMFAGRTGITFIAMNSLTGKKSINSIADYPEEDILVG